MRVPCINCDQLGMIPASVPGAMRYEVCVLCGGSGWVSDGRIPTTDAELALDETDELLNRLRKERA